MPQLSPLSKLRHFIVQQFNLEELKTLCQDLSIEFDILAGDGLVGSARELVAYMQRMDRLPELVAILKIQRGNIWEQQMSSFTLSQKPIVSPTNETLPSFEDDVEAEENEPAISPPSQPTIPSSSTSQRRSCSLTLTIGVLVLSTLGIGLFITVFPLGPRFSAPPPNLPANNLILSTNFQCDSETMNMANALSSAAESAQWDAYKINLQRIEQTDDPLVKARELNALMIVNGRCLTAQTLSITTTFAMPPAYPVTLLQEPPHVNLEAETSRAQLFTQAALFYAMGRYNQAHDALIELSDNPSIASQSDFNWLWGNILLRQGDWLSAIHAYTQALDKLPPTAPNQAEIFANRALASLFLEQDKNDMTACRINGRSDMQLALDLEPNRSDLHMLTSYIFLYCPQDTHDRDEKAVEYAALAADLVHGDDQTLAETLTLQADISYHNLGNDELGNPFTIQSNACEALQLNALSPNPYRVLGKTYDYYGLKEEARTAFEQYGHLAPLAWQREEARQLWRQSNSNGVSLPPSSLGQCP